MNGGKTKVDELRDALKDKAAKKKDKGKEAKGAGEVKEEVRETATAEADIKKMEGEIQAVEEEAKEHYDKLLRVMAEFENFKKRMEREKEVFLKYCNEGIVFDLLPVIDNLEKVLDHVPPDVPAEVKAIADGVVLVKKQICDILGRHGMTCVPAIGETFDPNCHEAVATVPGEECSENKVVEEHRKGYKLHDKLIRAAMVTVSKKKFEVRSPKSEVESPESEVEGGKSEVDSPKSEVDNSKKKGG